MTRKIIDWEALEFQYRAGIRSLRDIGGEFDVSDAAIIKRAKRDGWTRDLKAKIQAKAEAKVSAAMVSAEVSAQTKITERQVVEANAEAVARVRIAHRGDIHRARGLTVTLLAELEAQTGSLEALENLGDMLRAEDEKGVDRMNDLYRKVISTPSRIDSLKKVSETLKNLIGLEREAYGMATASDSPEAQQKPALKMTDEEIDRELEAIARRRTAA
jgi:hypothetical protein